MDKYFSKGLFYDEIRNCVGNFILISVLLIIKTIEIFARMDSLDDRVLGIFTDPIGFVVFFMFFGVITNLYESYNNKESKYGFMLTQPYKRDAIVVTKFLTTILSVILPLLIHGVIVSFIYMSNSGGDFPSGVLIKELWGNILFLISIYFFLAAFVQLSNKLIGNAIIAVSMPIGLAMIAPIILVIFILIPPLRIYADKLTVIFESIIISIGRILELNMILMPIILIAISLVIVCLSIFLNRRVTYEKTSDLFLFDFAETFFAYLGSLFISTVIVMISVLSVMKIFNFTLNADMYKVLVIIIITLTIVMKKLLYKFKRRMA